MVKFWDLEKERNFVYETGTKSYVSCLVGLREERGGVRFVTGSCKGDVVVWGGGKLFVHLAHQGVLANVDHVLNCNQRFFIAC